MTPTPCDPSNYDAYQRQSSKRRAEVCVICAQIRSSLFSFEELVFFLKLVLCVLLSGYVFVWAYFVIPTWRNRKLQAELQARAVAPSRFRSGCQGVITVFPK